MVLKQLLSISLIASALANPLTAVANVRPRFVESLLERRADSTNATVIPAPFVFPPSQYWDGIDGPWSSFALQVGTAAQDIRVQISTASAAVWTVQAGGCIAGGPAGCENSRGSLFLYNKSITYIPNSIFDLGLEQNLGLDLNTNYGFDTVTLGWQGSGGPTVQHVTIASIASYTYWLGMFGLNPQPTNFSTFSDPQPSYLTQLKRNNSIPSIAWGYTAGAQYRFNKVYGSLVLGGYDSSRFVPTSLSFPFHEDVSRNLLVNIQSITTDGPSKSLLPSGSITAFIDSTVPYIYLPLSACQAFESAFGLAWDNATQLYHVNDTLHTTLLSHNPNVTFTIGTSDSGGQTVNIVLPYGAFDLIADYPLVSNKTRYFPLKRAANDTQYTLGRT
ncbi:hypothetical protein LTR66_014271, partial [Elasticomyces elasticus]